MTDAPRYFITEPVPGGHAYYDVRDREGEYPNFSLVSVYKGTPGAKHIARNALRMIKARVPVKTLEEQGK